jgi:hypothetical protein
VAWPRQQFRSYILKRFCNHADARRPPGHQNSYWAAGVRNWKNICADELDSETLMKQGDCTGSRKQKVLKLFNFGETDEQTLHKSKPVDKWGGLCQRVPVVLIVEWIKDLESKDDIKWSRDRWTSVRLTACNLFSNMSNGVTRTFSVIFDCWVKRQFNDK